MPRDDYPGGWGKKDLEEFRAVQEEMLQVARDYSQTRLQVWLEEARGLGDSWTAFSREWQSALDDMTTLATDRFGEIAARSEATGSVLRQSFAGALAEISSEVEDWGDHMLEVLERVALAWTQAGGRGSGENWPGLLGSLLDFGGWFHQGGMVEAHQGLVVAPGGLMPDERLVLAQTGEGILPRESMARLGEKNFEALRTGRFETGAERTPSYNITIQVQALDAAGVSRLDWDRLVQRHILPALQREVVW
ncbi:MAG: hypothetical protein FJ126_00460 [Deltaproteobacteria bacterium]|nr:hypothetical protein [Deltaproteobacteria bacterium]